MKSHSVPDGIRLYKSEGALGVLGGLGPQSENKKLASLKQEKGVLYAAVLRCINTGNWDTRTSIINGYAYETCDVYN